MAALREAIGMAQDSNDNVCLQHALVCRICFKQPACKKNERSLLNPMYVCWGLDLSICTQISDDKKDHISVA